LTPPVAAQLRTLMDGLSDEERRVMLHHGDEEPFCGVFLAEKREGVFTCRLCGLPLFKAGTKFESGTGWPSFTAPFDEDHLRRVPDARYATETFEVVCARCGAQQGHVLTTARRRAGCVTASTPSRFASRRRASACPTSWAGVRPKAKCGTAEPVRRRHGISSPSNDWPGGRRWRLNTLDKDCLGQKKW
jgi:peptide methionine sulfoxide reductase MsrB